MAIKKWKANSHALRNLLKYEHKAAHMWHFKYAHKNVLAQPIESKWASNSHELIYYIVT